MFLPNVILLEYLRNLTDGLYIEQQIERFLGIRDMRVIDEFMPELN